MHGYIVMTGTTGILELEIHVNELLILMCGKTCIIAHIIGICNIYCYNN